MHAEQGWRRPERDEAALPAHTDRQALLRLALTGSVLLIAAGTFNSYLVYRQSEGEAASRLAAAAAERARVAERVLGHTVETHEIVRTAFAARWPSYQDAASAARFGTILELYPDGSWRNRKEIADGRIYPTGWVPKTTMLTDELRCSPCLWDLSQHYGPGAAIRHDNLYFMSFPEQSNLGYDPYLFPNFLVDIPETYNQLDYEWGRLAYLPRAAGRPLAFATPHDDDDVRHLGPIFQVLTPMHLGERHVATVATTLLLREFLARAIPQVTSDQRYLLFDAQGRLLADTHEPDVTAPSAAKATLQSSAATCLQRCRPQHAMPRAAGYSPRSDAYYAVAPVDGPDWYVASMLSGAAVRADALRVASWSPPAHAGVLAALLALLAYILRRQVAAPLGELTRAAEQVARGDTGVHLPAGRDDELGNLATAFNDMARSVAERDAALRHDKEQIEAALTSLRLSEERVGTR